MNHTVLALVLILILFSTPYEGKTPLYIGAILPYSKDGWIGAFGRQSVVGTKLAVKDINERNDVLEDYELKVIYRDSMVRYNS